MRTDKELKPFFAYREYSYNKISKYSKKKDGTDIDTVTYFENIIKTVSLFKLKNNIFLHHEYKLCIIINVLPFCWNNSITNKSKTTRKYEII